MAHAPSYRLHGVFENEPFETDAMLFEESQFSVGLTYRLPDGERRADWFRRLDNKRHGDTSDVPFSFVVTD